MIELLILILFVPLIIFAIAIIIFYIRNSENQGDSKSNYQEASGNSFFKTLFNKGFYGEFQTFVLLEKIPGYTKILTNIYLPKEDGTTTEIDLLMIHKTGIYVFESKNYSGWIFGDENSKQWTQSLKGGKKFKFYNPIWQNKGHILALQKVFEELNSSIFYSYIVFSERCELKKISVDIKNVTVLKRNKLLKMINNDIEARPEVLSVQQVFDLNKKLEDYILVSKEKKLQHIQSINIKSR